MKWLVAISLLVAVLALTALGLALKIGLALPPKFEDMTVDGAELQATNINLHIVLSNQTRREIAVGAVLDGSVRFGGSLIRDQHFGDSSLGTHVEPGDHALAVMIAGRPPVTNTFTFKTEPAMTNIVFIEVSGDGATKYRFKIKQSNKPVGIM